MATPFTPKQVTPVTAEILDELMGTASLDVTSHILENKLPPIPAGARIHDNGCGSGETTKRILETNPPSDIKIISTDANPYMINGCLQKAKQYNWPVEASVMPAQALTFPNEHFTYSFTNFVIMNMSQANLDSSAAHIYRTIKKGGKAVVCTWEYVPTYRAMLTAHNTTRGPDVKAAQAFPPSMFLLETLKKIVLSGGFKEESIEMSTHEVWITVKDMRRYVRLLWGLAGVRVGGWTQDDEDRWDEAVGILEKVLMKESPETCRLQEDGTWRMKYVANIAVATK